MIKNIISLRVVVNNYIQEHFHEIYKTKKIVCLYIPDIYSYMQPELIEILKIKIEDIDRRNLI